MAPKSFARDLLEVGRVLLSTPKARSTIGLSSVGIVASQGSSDQHGAISTNAEILKKDCVEGRKRDSGELSNIKGVGRVRERQSYPRLRHPHILYFKKGLFKLAQSRQTSCSLVNSRGPTCDTGV